MPTHDRYHRRIRMDDLALMRLHVEALFTHDASGDLVRVNEPNGAVAPRFFLGRTASGALLRFRQDVDADTRLALKVAVHDDAAARGALDAPSTLLSYTDILVRSGPVLRTEAGPAFAFPEQSLEPHDVVRVTTEHASLLEHHLGAWLPDIPVAQPMFVVVADGHAVSICASVRLTSAASEAGVETAPPYRGRGYAARAAAAWARAVRSMGLAPLYSTSWQNAASRAVARKLGLIHFGSDLHVT
jgi:GNAT superfamily N-acetyltransferase